MALDEKALFNTKPENRSARLQCPRCRRTSDYSVRWMRHSKKDRLPRRASDDDRAVTCKTCGKKFDIPSQHSLLFVDQLQGLPDEAELEREISEASGEPDPEPEPERKPALPARFTRRSSGWK